MTSSLSLYVGAWGGNGRGNSVEGGCATTFGEAGAGGAATLVLAETLSSTIALDDVVVIAAGGGGGGQGRAKEVGINGRDGRKGGIAIATTSGPVSGAGGGELSAKGDGTGACGPTGPFDKERCGADGIGGRGGGVAFGANAIGWVGTSSGWGQGQGGFSKGGDKNGGAGGGGYGGGEAGRVEPFNLNIGGGGAGASHAARATVNDNGAPVLGPGGSPTSNNGGVVISFDVCRTYPSIEACQP